MVRLNEIKDENNKAIFSAIISILCLQVAFADPGWVVSGYPQTASMAAAIVSDVNGGLLTGTDDCGYCCEVLGCSPLECCAGGTADSNDILAAFGPDGTCRGLSNNIIAEVGPYVGALIHSMEIRSNDLGDLITFLYYDASVDAILVITDYEYVFEINGIICYLLILN